MRVDIARLHPRASLPRRMSAGAAGLDLFACVPDEGPLELAPGARALVPTGLQVQLPAGYEAQVRPRSGLALRHGVTVLNGPGTLDADYRGELGVLLVNLGSEPFVVRHGDRVAQLVIAPVVSAEPVEVAVQSPPRRGGRGGGGFGSTGGFGGRPSSDPPPGSEPPESPESPDPPASPEP